MTGIVKQIENKPRLLVKVSIKAEIDKTMEELADDDRKVELRRLDAIPDKQVKNRPGTSETRGNHAQGFQNAQEAPRRAIRT